MRVGWGIHCFITRKIFWGDIMDIGEKVFIGIPWIPGVLSQILALKNAAKMGAPFCEKCKTDKKETTAVNSK